MRETRKESIEKAELLYKKNSDLIERLLSKGISLNPLTKFCTVEYPPRSALGNIETNKRNETVQNIFSKISEPVKGGLYIHIPWCTRSCTFCNFYFDVMPASRVKEGVEKNFINLLEKEMERISLLTRNSLSASSVYFGGGSPSLLNPDQIRRLLDSAEKYLNFDRKNEVSLEIHPEILRLKGSDYLSKIKEIGVNRVSIGFQSSNKELLRKTARGHTVDESLKVLKETRKLFDNINIDLMYGFHDQNLDSWCETLLTVFELKPECITTYFLEIKPTSPEYSVYKRLENDKEFNVLNFKKVFLLQTIAEMHGYKQKARSYWLREGKDTFRHILDKWKTDDTVLIGLGPSTYNWIFLGPENNWFYYKVYNNVEFSENLENGIYPVERVVIMDKEETVRRHIIFGFRDGGIPEEKLQTYLERLDEQARNEINQKLTGLQKLGLLTKKDSLLTFTDVGNCISHEISQFFARREHLSKASQSTSPEEKKYEYYSSPELLRKLEELVMSG